MEKKNKTAVVRIVLDVVMLVVIASLLSVNAVSRLYHEIAGLALIALFVVHILLNQKQLKALAKTKSVSPARIKWMAVLDVLLCIAWLLSIGTGILVSRSIFGFHIRSLNGLHKLTSQIAVLITGAHFGIHWGVIRVKLQGCSGVVRKVVAAILIALVCFSGFGTGSQRGFRRGNTRFAAQQMRGDDDRGYGRRDRENLEQEEDTPGEEETEGQEGESSRRGRRRGRRNGRRNREAWQNEENAEAMQNENEKAPAENDGEAQPTREAPAEEDSEAAQDENEEGRGRRGRGRGRRGNRRGDGFRGERGERGGRGRRGFSVVRLLSTLVNGISRICLYAAAVYGIDTLFSGKRKKEDDSGKNEEPKENE